VFAPLNMSISASVKYGRSDVYSKWLCRSSWLDLIFFPIRSDKWVKTLRIWISPRGFIWLFFRLPLRLIKGKYSLFAVHSRDPQAIIVLIISKLLKKPIIVFDSYYMWIKNDISASLLWPLSRFVCFQSTYLSVSSFRVANFWVSAGIDIDKIRLNYKFASTLESSKKNSAIAIRTKKKLGYKKIVLFVGRLIEEKGIDYLIRAFAKFSGFKNVGLLIIGDGPERNRLEKLCQDLNLTNVVFLCARAEIEPYFELCDILVLPSITLRIHEEWGVVVNEAMSVSKPVIVSAGVGCAYELVKNSVNGYIVPEKDSDALFRAMEKLINNDKLRQHMGIEAKKTVDNRFTPLHVVAGHMRMQQEALQRLVS
jgi:glycosyltransferase involved in cell wall biosynthesis